MSLDLLLRALLAWAPFHVFFSVFLGSKLGIPGISLIKDLLLVTFVMGVVYAHIRAKKMPKLGLLDISIGAYILWMIIASLIAGSSLRAMLVGLRFDTQFLIAFLAAYHARPFLTSSPREITFFFLKWFGIALGIGVFVRFITKEYILLWFGWSANLSNWETGGVPPLWHGIPGANIRRFQGIFDGPNQTATLLLGYISAFFLYTLPSKKLRDFWLILGTFLIGLLFLTYTRSALLAFVAAGGIFTLLSLKTLWKKHKKTVGIAIVFFACICSLFYLRYEDRLTETFHRDGSTAGHFERMVIGLHEWGSSPVFGKGLASSGPAVRLSGKTVPKEEKTFIPESWYVQQLVEGGTPALILFALVLGIMLFLTWRAQSWLGAGLLAIAGMNLLLHAFESGWVVVPFFVLCGIYAATRKKD